MKDLKIEKTFFKVSEFIGWKKQKKLNLSPNFQRRPVWQPGAKSYFIDTIVRDLPIPILFLRDRHTNLKTLDMEREVVDGQQRLRTLISYIMPSLLEDYKPKEDDFTVKKNHNREIAGKKFEDLEDKYKRKILDYSLDVHILPSEVEDREVFDIFRRMNATGIKLNAQELRNAQFYGEFRTIMYELALEQLNKWQEWKLFTNTEISRMIEVEYISDFAVLMREGVKRKSNKIINDMYEYYENKENNNINVHPEINTIENRFRIVINSIDDLIGEEINSSLYKNKTLFYILFAYIYDLQFGINSPLKKIKAKPVPKNITNKILNVSKLIETSKAPLEVLNSYERRTTDQNSRETLLKFVKDKVK